ncbi:TPA: hypothetical protein N0F65_006296 [Lagenidium giganteum]|uniref:Sphingomyelin synthase-like domain-containing protein n=1 Tax=Lagenidium giganteum TaxID=4803 RepID=A0AAV2YPK3_9STRA|nr:TPA: hypothetical protein N0F65_006296 [Lagenidium giganteum]
MSSYLPFVHTRTKRKMSGPVVLSFDKDVELSKRVQPSSASSAWVHQTWCEICRHIDTRELLAFLMWEALTVFIAVAGVADWIFFFKFVVEPEDHRTRMQWGAVWAVGTVLLLSFRRFVRSRCGADVSMLADHAEIFITVSLIMVCATNVAFYIHTPSSTPLRDLGFMLIPEQAVDSKWRPLSDILTAVMPLVFMVHSYFMTRENRCRVVSTFFRCASICYGLRMCTIALTSLPGPAPHCRPGSPNYYPPKTWIDIITRVGPMYGNYNSCGDLIFSGHMAYTTTAVLLYLRVLDRYNKRHSRVRWIVGVMYLATLAILCVSGRKHYTVDVVLGVITATLVFFHFEHGWVPLCFQVTYDQLPLRTMTGPNMYQYPHKRLIVEEEDESDDEARDDVDDEAGDAEPKSSQQITMALSLRAKNFIMGSSLGVFAASVFMYTVHQMSKDDFEGLDEVAKVNVHESGAIKPTPLKKN